MPEANRGRRVAIAVIGAAGLSVASIPLMPIDAGASASFELGSGKVRANLFEVVPRTGGLTIPYSGGKSSAAYQGSRAEATATVGKPFLPVEPKAITDILEGKPPKSPVSTPLQPAQPAADCGDKAPGGGGGGEPSAPPTASPFTFNLTVNSDEEKSEAGKHDVFMASPADSPVQGAMAEQQVFATDAPEGHAIATQGRMGVAGVFEMTGGRSETRSGVVDGKARRSEGSVTIGKLVLLGGAVVMENMRWDAIQRTGEGEAKQSRFTMGSATIGGTPFASPDSGGGAEFFKAVNDALAPTGLIIEPPTVADDEDDARITPMSLRMSDSPLGRAAIGPLVGEAQPVRDPLVGGLLGFSCDFGLFVTVADVAISVASGSGGIAFNFGGINATTDGTVFDNPFGDGFDPGLGGGFGELPAGDVPSQSEFVPGSGAFGAEPFPALGLPSTALPLTSGPLFPDPLFGASPAPEALPPDLAPSGDEELAGPAFDGSVQPALGSSVKRGDGSRGGSALAAGVIGLLAIAALVAADAFHIRRVAGGGA